jgi:hypothetical protein
VAMQFLAGQLSRPLVPLFCCANPRPHPCALCESHVPFARIIGREIGRPGSPLALDIVAGPVPFQHSSRWCLAALPPARGRASVARRASSAPAARSASRGANTGSVSARLASLRRMQTGPCPPRNGSRAFPRSAWERGLGPAHRFGDCGV